MRGDPPLIDCEKRKGAIIPASCGQFLDKQPRVADLAIIPPVCRAAVPSTNTAAAVEAAKGGSDATTRPQARVLRNDPGPGVRRCGCWRFRLRSYERRTTVA